LIPEPQVFSPPTLVMMHTESLPVFAFPPHVTCPFFGGVLMLFFRYCRTPFFDNKWLLPLLLPVALMLLFTVRGVRFCNDSADLRPCPDAPVRGVPPPFFFFFFTPGCGENRVRSLVYDPSPNLTLVHLTPDFAVDSRWAK